MLKKASNLNGKPSWFSSHKFLSLNDFLTFSRPSRNELRKIDGKGKLWLWKLLMERTWTYMYKPHAAIKKHVKRKSAGWENTTTATTSEKWQWFPRSTPISSGPYRTCWRPIETATLQLAAARHRKASWHLRHIASRPLCRAHLPLVFTGSPADWNDDFVPILSLFKMSPSYKYFSENIQHLVL